MEKIDSSKLEGLYPKIKKVSENEFHTFLRIKANNGKWVLNRIYGSSIDRLLEGVYHQQILGAGHISDSAIRLQEPNGDFLYIEDELQHSEEDRLLEHVKEMNARFDKFLEENPEVKKELDL